MKYLVCILTSSNLNLLKRCYISVKNQKGINFDITIIVNSLDNNYYNQVVRLGLSCKVINTVSNGRAGKGHNSCLNYFLGTNYDRLILIDGDDLFYPNAFTKFKDLPVDLDILHTFINDKYTKDGTIQTIKNPEKLKDNLHILFQNPYKNFVNCKTPSRLIIFSKNAAEKIKYCENSRLFDDLKAFISLLHHKELKSYYTLNNDIYLYNADNPESLTKKYKVYHINQEIKAFNMYKSQFRINWEEDIRHLKMLDIPKTEIDKKKFLNNSF
jgi:hypothetical protein